MTFDQVFHSTVKACQLSLLTLGLCGAISTTAHAQKNPFITDMYTADPSAHVWKDGTIKKVIPTTGVAQK